VPLSPDEIESKQFLTVLRGFDPEEVTAFLERVADDMRTLLTTLYAALPPVGATEESRKDLDELLLHSERVTGEVARLVEAGRVAQIDSARIVREAEEEAERLRQTASQERREAVRQAAQLLERARQEVQKMTEAAARERAELVGELQRMATRLGDIEAEAHLLRTRALDASADRDPGEITFLVREQEA
jgi:cell division initiation protein